MRKILFIILLCYGQLYALDEKSTLELFHKVFKSMTYKASNISIYVEDKEYAEVFKKSLVLRVVNSPHGADIIFITTRSMLNKILLTRDMTKSRTRTEILFTIQYRLIDESPDIPAAFYWRKGRTQLLFIRDRLLQYGITMPSEYEKFTIEKI